MTIELSPMHQGPEDLAQFIAQGLAHLQRRGRDAYMDMIASDGVRFRLFDSNTLDEGLALYHREAKRRLPGFAPGDLDDENENEDDESAAPEPPLPSRWSQLHPVLRMVVLETLRARAAEFRVEAAKSSARMMGIQSTLGAVQGLMQAKGGPDAVTAQLFDGINSSMFGQMEGTEQALIKAFELAIEALETP